MHALNALLHTSCSWIPCSSMKKYFMSGKRTLQVRWRWNFMMFSFFLFEDKSFIKNLMEHFTRQSFENSSNQRYFLLFIGKLENCFWNEITSRFIVRLCFSFYGGDRLCWWVHNYFNVSDWSWKINHSFEITQFIKFNESPQLSATTEFHTTYRKFPVFDNLIHIDILFFRRQK